MEILLNPYRGTGLPCAALEDIPWPASDLAPVLELLRRCPRAAVTPLVAAPDLACLAGVAELLVKDERGRMGLGSFKALGAAYVVARDHVAGRAAGQTYVTASAGNHGLSLAAGALAFGARAQVHLAASVPESFADRLRHHGAEAVRSGAIYEEAMAAALAAAGSGAGILVSDSSWPGYTARPHVLMEGYLALAAEAAEQLAEPPSHVVLQAGVGGLAAAVAAFVRARWGDAPRIIVVEPAEAPALYASIAASEPAVGRGGVSVMGRLDCKEPSLIALKGLARDADAFVLLSEAASKAGTGKAAAAGLASTPSGAAGIAMLLAAGAQRVPLGLDERARVLAILTEQAGP